MQKNTIISSLHNEKIVDLIKLRDNKSYREEKGLVFLEGDRLIKDSPIDLLDSIYINEDYDNDLSIFDKINIYKLKNNVFNKVKSTVHSQGIVAISKYKINTDYKNILSKNIKNIIFLDNIKDPGNMGTIFRTCEASGIDYIVISKDSCDIFNPKVLRSSMSSIFRLNIIVCDDNLSFIDMAKSNDYRILSTTLDNNNKYYNYNFINKKNIIIFGNEANGIDYELIEKSDDRITIPMSGNIESLNVSVSCALILYEIKKQIDNYER